MMKIFLRSPPMLSLYKILLSFGIGYFDAFAATFRELKAVISSREARRFFKLASSSLKW